MARARRNHERESRIHEEIIVDAYGPEEQAMSWYYYLEEKLRFPFQAQCIASVPTSPLRKIDTLPRVGPSHSQCGELIPPSVVPVDRRPAPYAPESTRPSGR